jgi:malonyl-CoA O-methyltransferase
MIGKLFFKKTLLETYNKCKNWIYDNTVPQKGIVVETGKQYKNIPYPEVSGYYIPSLLNWGERKLAFQYAQWLASIQHKDGSWYDAFDKKPYIFDTAQILKGLISVHLTEGEYEKNIINGCNWLISNVEDTGRLPLGQDMIAIEIENCSDLIHLYCISPLIEAGKIFNNASYIEFAEKILGYYKKNNIEKILNFHTLSHFYAYIMEGLCDVGEIDIVREAMAKVAKLQNKDGSVPAYENVKWICSTGLFQFAIVWYKIGEKERADKAFEYACSMQNRSGGWFGSIGKNANYCPKEEISWANKYFLDALSWKMKTHFISTAGKGLKLENGTYSLTDEIKDDDGRILTVLDSISGGKTDKICEVGCGFGRIVRKVKEKYPKAQVYAIDLDNEILSKLPSGINAKTGSLLNIPYEYNAFDFVYCVEAIEHAIDIENAVCELFRVTKSGGKVLIIDKNIKLWGKYKTPSWEQWFDKNKLKNIIAKYSDNTSIIENIPYDNCSGKDGLFIGWVGVKR